MRRWRLRGFWNDPEGWTVNEFLVVIIGLPCAAILIITAILFGTGKITEVHVSALNAMSPWVVVALGGYYGGQMIMQRWGMGGMLGGMGGMTQQWNTWGGFGGQQPVGQEAGAAQSGAAQSGAAQSTPEIAGLDRDEDMPLDDPEDTVHG